MLRECLPADAAGVVAPGTGDGAVDEERADRLRHLRREDARPVLLGEHARPTNVDEEDAVPGRQEPNRCGNVGWRERRAREVEELAAGLVAEAPQPQASERRVEVARLASRPTARCRRATPARTRRDTGERGGRVPCPRRRPPARPSVSASWNRCARRSLPCSRRRHADEVEPRPDHAPAATDDSTSSSCATRPVGEKSREAARPGARARRPRTGFRARSEPLALRAADRDRKRPVIAARDDVDRPAHQRRLDRPNAARALASGRRARSPRGTTRAGCTRSARTDPGCRRSARGPAGSADARARAGADARGARGSARAG